MIHLYAVLGVDATVPPIDGLDGRPVIARRVGELTAAVGVVDQPPEPSNENVLCHAAVVDALAELNAAVLPARFSRPFATEGVLEAALDPLTKQLQDALAEVSGCVELGVRAFRPTADGDAARRAERPSAGEYLRLRLASEAERSELAATVSSPLEGHARTTRRRVGGSGTVLLNATYLVQTDTVPAFRDEIERLQRGHPELTIVCTGPWPPYSFAAVPAEAA